VVALCAVRAGERHRRYAQPVAEEREGKAGLGTVVAAAAVFAFLVVAILGRALVLRIRDAVTRRRAQRS
jgi:hypothetical protein